MKASIEGFASPKGLALNAIEDYSVIICQTFQNCFIPLPQIQIFRHGDRSPVNVFPTEPNKENTWPQGFGQLSVVRFPALFYSITLRIRPLMPTSYMYLVSGVSSSQGSYL